MSKIKAVTYKESLIAFFEQQLAHANRQLDWAVKHNPDCYVCAEKGEIVSFYQDAITALREQEEREKGCEYCNDLSRYKRFGYAELFHQTAADEISEIGIGVKCCPNCGRKLKGEKEDV